MHRSDAHKRVPGVPKAWWIGGLIFFLLLVALMGISFRQGLAQVVLAGGCRLQALSCEGAVTRLSAQDVVLSDVRISYAGGTLAVASRVALTLDWRGPFSPEITGVSVTGLEVRMVLQPGSDPLPGVGRFRPGPPGTAARAVRLDIRDARILLATPFGPVSGKIDISGTFPGQGDLALLLEPAALSFGRNRLSLEETRLSAQVEDDRMLIGLLVRVREAQGTRLSLSEGQLMVQGLFFPRSGDGGLSWTAAIASAEAPLAKITGFTARGQADFAGTWPQGRGAIGKALTRVQAEAVSEQVILGRLVSGPASLSVDLAGAQGALDGPVRLEAENLAFAGYHAAGLNLTGAAGTDPPALSGEILVRALAPLARAGMAPETASLLLQGLSGVDRDFACALVQAPGGIDAALSMVLVPDPSGMEIRSQGVLEFGSAGGAAGRLYPPAQGPWLRMREGEVFVSGGVELSAEGLGAFKAPFNELRFPLSRLARADRPAYPGPEGGVQDLYADCPGSTGASAGRTP